MSDEEREMLELMWENFFPLVDDVANSLELLVVLNHAVEDLGERVRRLEDADPLLH